MAPLDLLHSSFTVPGELQKMGMISKYFFVTAVFDTYAMFINYDADTNQTDVKISF